MSLRPPLRSSLLHALGIAAMFAVSAVTLPTIELRAQPVLPHYYNANGDTIPYIWPPPDSAYVSNEIIIRFHPQALNLDLLCYGPPPEKTSSGQGLQSFLPRWYQYELMQQRFDLDSGIIVSTGLRNTMKAFGGLRLRRMTVANPCADTISISRYGDTLVCRDYLWLVLELDNDSSVINAATWLTGMHRNSIAIAEPNYYITQFGTPGDAEYLPRQRSLQIDGIGMEKVWGTAGVGQVGNYEIKVAIVDDGVDYTHCDFGGNFGVNQKVSWLFDVNNPNIPFPAGADHGTAVAGIIGASTENRCVENGPLFGIAGIGGGWMTAAPAKRGLQLLALKIARNQTPGLEEFTVADASHAIRQAAAYNPQSGYGQGAHVINCSWGTASLNFTLKEAVNWAFEHGASVVAARGNLGGMDYQYPSGFNERWVCSVGGADGSRDRCRATPPRSSFGTTMDLVAPSGNRTFEPIVRTTDLVLQGTSRFTWFDGTSAAAAHVSGVIGLLRSEALDRSGSEPAGMWSRLRPEDYEGILTASCKDRHSRPSNEPQVYRRGYDDATGWGHLQADRAFEMLANGYRIGHYSRSDNMVKGTASRQGLYHFEREGNTGFKSIPVGDYFAEIRSVDFTIELESGLWDTSQPVYVWGHSTGRGGLSLEPYNNQTDYTRIGNTAEGRSTNDDHDEILLEPTGDQLVVRARTYQFDLFELMPDTTKGTYIGTFPSDDDLRANFSVFARQGVLHADRTMKAQADALSVSPQPVQDVLTVRLTPIDHTAATLRLLDAQGRTLSQQHEAATRDATGIRFEVDVRGMAPGAYFCVVRAGVNTFTAHVVIIH